MRLKLLTPLGVLTRVLKDNVATLESRLAVVQAYANVLRSIRNQLEAYSKEMRSDAERYLIEMRNVLYELERRGRSWSSALSGSATRFSSATRMRSRTVSAPKSCRTRRSRWRELSIGWWTGPSIAT